MINLSTNNQSTEKGRLLFIAGLLLICVVLGIFSSKRNNYVEEHGVWTISTVDHIESLYRGGYNIGFYYYFTGARYRGGGTMGRDEINPRKIGKRFFIMVLPGDPKRYVGYSSLPVPDWFILEAPPKGWATRPTDLELMTMMIQDSVRRGLK